MSQGDVSDDSSSDCSSDNEPQTNDSDGIWSPDIEQSFLEALAIYPPCGRRKIILSEEGKMYGRNELIARYIKLRTGKTRTRKQVSSHIQVLARRKSKEIQANVKDQTSKERIVQSLSSMSSSQIVSATALQEKTTNQNNGITCFLNSRIGANPSNSMYSHLSQYTNNETGPRQFAEEAQPFHSQHFPSSNYYHHHHHEQQQQQQHEVQQQVSFSWTQNQFKLIKYQAYIQSVKSGQTNRHNFINLDNNLAYENGYHQTVSVVQLLDKFPDISGGLPQLVDEGNCNNFYLIKCWADLKTDLYDFEDVFYGVSSEYEGRGTQAINISTKVCSFGKQVVEKVETDNGLVQFDGSPLSLSTSSSTSSSSSSPGVIHLPLVTFRNDRSCMCEYMISFINKLRKLPEKYMMNSVLENFTVIQVIRNHSSNEILLCLAFTFEVAEIETNESQRIIYQITK